MTRSDFIALLGGTAVADSLAANGQQPAKVPQLGILFPAASEAAATLTAFRDAIRNLGYIEGQTIVGDCRLSQGIMDALPTLAAELVRNPVDVIVTDTPSRHPGRIWRHTVRRSTCIKNGSYSGGRTISRSSKWRSVLCLAKQALSSPDQFQA